MTAAASRGAGRGKRMLNAAHGALVFDRRVRVLAGHVADAMPDATHEGGSFLDLGCGEGRIARAVADRRPDLTPTGIDVMVRPTSWIPVTAYDGVTVPHPDNSFDYVTLIDVLHHTRDPAAVLLEALRIARHGVILKDHLCAGFLAGPTLRVMDWVGNRGHEVVLPYNYLTQHQWDAVFETAGCRIALWQADLGLYPQPADMVFGRSLHFIARLLPRA